MREYCPEACQSCSGLGYTKFSNKSVEDFERSLVKASEGGYQSVFLPCNLIFETDLLIVLNRLREKNMKVILQVNLKSLREDLRRFILSFDGTEVIMCFLIESMEVLNQINFEMIKKDFPDCLFHLVISKQLDVSKCRVLLQQNILKDLYVTAPHKEKSFDLFLSCRELYHFTIKNSELCDKTFSGLDLYDPRISSSLELEISAKPMITYFVGDQTPQISVIIPTYNNETYILNTLRHLSQQSLSIEKFEVIVVNDGSDDNSHEKILSFLNEKKFQYLYFYCQRPKKREMGDAQFRAGVSRNLGAKWARGEILSFLDADMIVPSHYLETVLSELHIADLVQPKRYFLKKEVSTEQLAYNNINADQDTFIPEGGYWHNFYQVGEKWNDLQAPWKYVCTYGLSLKKDLFFRLGRFRKTYMFYGFEDTDLGYRLKKSGAIFLLSKAVIYHLNQRDERSEYSNSQILRNLLLAKTGRIFYRHYLDPRIYEELKFLINDGFMMERIALRARSTFVAFKDWINEKTRSIKMYIR